MEIEISNPNRIVYKKNKTTKIDVVKYYSRIAKYMFPYIENRPLSVIRCHKNTSESFFKKHPTVNSKFIGIIKVNNEAYFYIKAIEGIVEQIQLGTLEFHTWASQANSINKPNIMVFDLDPDKNVELSKLQMGVLHLKSVLDELNLKSYLKTSGGKGYHILIPFSSSTNWGKFYGFSQQIALLLEQKWPNIFTTNIRKKDRKNKIFVDYLRNSKGATCVAPYSLRARTSPTISMPISYKDISKYTPQYFTINSTLNFKNNPWKDFFSITQTLK